MKSWQLQDAKARFSELVKTVITQGPQSVTVHGKVAAVLISKEDYDQLAAPKSSFLTFLQRSPLMGLKINIKRDKSTTRDVDL